jgi:hypothetical protein
VYDLFNQTNPSLALSFESSNAKALFLSWVMRQVCKFSGNEFQVEPEDLEFYEKVSPQVEAGSLYIPPPPSFTTL